MKSRALAVVLLVAVPPAVAQSITSAYTELSLDKCRLSGQAGPGDGEWASWSCKGFAGLPVRVFEGDLRFSVSYGPFAEKQCAAQQTFGAFNHLGPTIEWRLAGGKPFATILRWRTEVEDDKHSWLVVSRLAGEEACHVAYVDAALPGANSVARQRADLLARSFDCAQGRAEILSPRKVELTELVSGSCHSE